MSRPLSAVFAFAVLTVAAPAPTVDRVGFPKGYQDTWKKLRESDDTGHNAIKVVYANDVAASWETGAYAYGSILIIETWNAALDTQKKVLRDDAGHFQKDQLTGLDVMRKERGFGEAYRENRAGEWEFVEYRPDGSYITPPAASAKCASCHLEAGAAKDYVYDRSAKM